MKEREINEVINPAGTKIIREHMREMLRIGETDESIKSMNQALRSVEDLLKKKRTTLSKTNKAGNARSALSSS